MCNQPQFLVELDLGTEYTPDKRVLGWCADRATAEVYVTRIAALCAQFGALRAQKPPAPLPWEQAKHDYEAYWAPHAEFLRAFTTLTQLPEYELYYLNGATVREVPALPPLPAEVVSV